jgi:cytoskeletal protein CcmA (bactofilin family)
MFRQGRNPKDQTHTADDTADHTPQSPAGAGSSYGSPAAPAASTPAATPTEAYQQSVYTQTTSRAVTESESLARDIKEGTLTGFVGNGTTLTGEASFKGMLRVDGGLSGRVSSADGTLIVSTNGRVDANVEVAVAQIYGTVNGDITATKRIEMGRVAKVTGNIQTPALVIENGALFEGSCRMVQIKEESEKTSSGTAAAGASSSTTSSGAPLAASSGAPLAASSGSSSSASSSGKSGKSGSSSPASSSDSVTDVTDAATDVAS